MTFKLILSAVNPELFEAFKKHFSKFPDVEVVFAPFEQTEFDCVVSAANSFGLMDGGVDQCITDYFGLQMMRRVQGEIIKQYYGEQPVGTSMIVRGNEKPADWLNGEKNKYVAHTPTMRIPMDISNTNNVYSAMKAVLVAVEKHNLGVDAGENGHTRIDRVVCPGLGTNTGRVPADKAAKDMSMALYHFLNPPHAIDWYYASQRHNEIVSGELDLDTLTALDLSAFENLE